MEFLLDHWPDVVSVAVVLLVGMVFTVSLERKYKTTGYVGFLNYIPSIWTSLGILGTFVSIYASLALIDFNSPMADMNQLVSRVAPAFSTSIVGIIGAIITSIRYKKLRALAEVQEERGYWQTMRNIEDQVTSMGVGAKEVAREMGREMVQAAGEQWRQSLREHIIAMEGMMEQERKNFEKNTAELVSNLKEVATAHRQSMSALLAAYENEAGQVKTAAAEAMKEMTDSHKEQIKGMAAAQKEHLSELDGQIKETLKGAYEEFSASIVSASVSMKEIAVEMNQVMSAVQETGAAVKSAGEAFKMAKSDIDAVRTVALAVMAESKEHMDANGRKVEELLANAEKVSAKMNDLVASAAGSVAKASQMVDRMEAKVRASQTVRPQTQVLSSKEPSKEPGAAAAKKGGWIKKIFSNKKQ